MDDRVARFALEPFATAGERPAWRIVRTGWGTIGFSPSPLLTFVDGIRIDGDVRGAVEEARATLREAGRTSAYWLTGPLTEPAGLADALRAEGLRPPDGGPLEPTGTALALDREPDAEVPADVETEVVAEPDAVVDGMRVLALTNGIPPEQADGAARAMATAVDGETQSLVVARVGGMTVAAATAVRAEAGFWLTGGATLPEARGRGAYRALVAARWQQAVAAGTPALVVQAGSMSRPLLERMGFRRVGELTVLRDELQ